MNAVLEVSEVGSYDAETRLRPVRLGRRDGTLREARARGSFLGVGEMTEDFTFLDPGELVDGDLELVLVRKVPADPVKGHVPGYVFEMRSRPGGTVIGSLRFRVGDADTVLKYPCHVGYDVKPQFRGHRYASRSVLLILPFARAHGLTRLWISCAPDNVASRKTCERAGAKLCAILAVPEDHDMYAKGFRTMCRYCIDL